MMPGLRVEEISNSGGWGENGGVIMEKHPQGLPSLPVSVTRCLATANTEIN